MNSPKITNILLSLLVLVVLILGFFVTPSKSEKAPSISASPSFQRFLPIPPQPQFMEGLPAADHFALDTKTGQLCKTYDWDIPRSDTNPIPTCRDLLGQ
jgi:hypothetical protein